MCGPRTCVPRGVGAGIPEEGGLQTPSHPLQGTAVSKRSIRSKRVCQVTFRGFRCKNLTFSRNLGGTGTVAAEGVRRPNVALPVERPGGGGRKAVLRLRRVYC